MIRARSKAPGHRNSPGIDPDHKVWERIAEKIQEAEAQAISTRGFVVPDDLRTAVDLSGQLVRDKRARTLFLLRALTEVYSPSYRVYVLLMLRLEVLASRKTKKLKDLVAELLIHYASEPVPYVKREYANLLVGLGEEQLALRLIDEQINVYGDSEPGRLAAALRNGLTMPVGTGANNEHLRAPISYQELPQYGSYGRSMLKINVEFFRIYIQRDVNNVKQLGERTTTLQSQALLAGQEQGDLQELLDIVTQPSYANTIDFDPIHWLWPFRRISGSSGLSEEGFGRMGKGEPTGASYADFAMLAAHLSIGSKFGFNNKTGR